MEIEQLKKENPETKRKELNWLNPQSDMKIKYKNKRNYYQLVSKLGINPFTQPPTHTTNKGPMIYPTKPISRPSLSWPLKQHIRQYL